MYIPLSSFSIDLIKSGTKTHVVLFLSGCKRVCKHFYFRFDDINIISDICRKFLHTEYDIF